MGLVVAAVAGLFVLPGADAADGPIIQDPIVLRSYDGTPIVATLMLPAGASAEAPVPVILQTHGWGGTRQRTIGGLVGRLLDRGYAILTWDSPGFGDSGGSSSPGGPAEVAAASMLMDYLATRPEILRDGPGDPRVGWIGGSNGGGVQLNTAAVDHRVDAISPQVSWGDLLRDLLPNGAPKLAWTQLLYAGGMVGATREGLDSPAGIQLSNYPAQLHVAEVEGLALQQFDADTAAWFAERSTVRHSGRITAPTLLIQGTIDTLFPLEEAFANYANLVAAGTPVKVLTTCGGHSIEGCTYPYGRGSTRDWITAAPVPDDRVVAWMDRWVRGDASVDTGPQVEWQANDGRYYGGPSLPLPGTEWVEGVPMRTGTLVGPGLSGGDGLADGNPAEPHELGLTAARAEVLPAAEVAREIVGVPVARVSGQGYGLTAQVHFELVDVSPYGVRVTLGGQVMPLRFAGRIDQDIELRGVSWRLRAGHSLELEITTGSGQFAPPLTGPFTVDLTAQVRLPVSPATAPVTPAP